MWREAAPAFFSPSRANSRVHADLAISTGVLSYPIDREVG
jgi:hypothetical protein